MRYIICFVFLTILFGSAQAQSDVPALITNIEHAENDSLRAVYYRRIFEKYHYTDPDSARYYLREAEAYFRESKYKRGLGMMKFLEGNLNSTLGRLDISKQMYTEALKIYEEIDNRSGIAQANNGIGVAEGKAGNYLSATRHFMLSLHEFEVLKDTNGILNTYLKLGTVNNINNDFGKALDYFNKAITLAEKISDARNTAYLYNAIGTVYGKMEKADTAIAYFEKALSVSANPALLENKLHALMNMGNVYKDKGNFTKSLDYYNQALSLTSPDHIPETYARLQLNIATIVGVKDHKGALQMLEEARGLAREIGERALHLEIMAEMILQNRLLGDYKMAFTIQQEAMVLQDSLDDIEKATEIANLQSKYELEKSNEKVDQLVAASKKEILQRNIIISIAAILALTLITLTYSYLRTGKINRKLVKSEAELQKTSAIKDRIFSIIGHDLRGPIANIPMVIELYQDERTSPAEKAYMLDLLIENSMASLETLDKLLHWGKAQIKGTSIEQKSFRASQNLQHQISLIKGVASNKNITIKNEVPADTTLYADEDHFNFVIRNLLSNAIKFSHRDSDVVIDADRYTERGFTVFSVKDQGVGIEPDRLHRVFEAFGSSTVGTNNESGTSIGLMLCKEFVIENGGKIWVESEPDKGTTFFFTLKNA